MTARQREIRQQLEGVEAYINLQWNDLSEPMRGYTIALRKRILKDLLKVQTEEFERS